MQKIKLFLFLLLFLPFITHASFEISDGSVLGLYHAEDTADSSGNGKNLTNDTAVTFSTAKLIKGFTYDGTGDSVYRTGTDFAFERTASFTITTWIKFNSTSTSQRIIGKQNFDLATAPGYYIDLMSGANAGKINIGFSNNWDGGNKIDCRSDNAIVTSTNVWYFLTMRYAGTSACSGVDLYIGTSTRPVSLFSGTLSSSIVDTSEKLRIGNDGGNIRAFSDTSQIDEITIHTSILSTTTITALYNNGNGSEICTTAGCATSSGTSTINSITMSTTTDAVFNKFLQAQFLLELLIITCAIAWIVVLMLRRK